LIAGARPKQLRSDFQFQVGQRTRPLVGHFVSGRHQAAAFGAGVVVHAFGPPCVSSHAAAPRQAMRASCAGLAAARMTCFVLTLALGATGEDSMPAGARNLSRGSLIILPQLQRLARGNGRDRANLPCDYCSSTPADVAVIYNRSLYTAEKRARRSSDPAGRAGDTTA